MKLDYWVVDAFADRVFAGNPACVVLPGEALPAPLMQSIAAENNLSETAFAVPDSDADGGFWHLRWFTPTVEVDLCGHATLATAFVLARLGHAGPFRFSTRSGMLAASVLPDGIELDFPARSFAAAAAPAGIAEALGAVPVELVQSADLIAVLDSPAAVARLKPDMAAIARLPGGTLIATAQGGENADVTSRYFAPAYGIDEDPVTGSLHTQVVPYWAAALGRTTLVCHQASARGGMLHCQLRGSRVLMRGRAVLYASGTIFVT